MAPREFNSNLEKARLTMKNTAKGFLTGNNKNATLENYMTACMNTDGVSKDDFDAVFYYIADGYYEAKGEKFEDNREEVERVYDVLMGPINILMDLNNMLLEISKEPEEGGSIETQEEAFEIEQNEFYEDEFNDYGYEDEKNNNTDNQARVETNEKTTKKKADIKVGVLSLVALFPIFVTVILFIVPAIELFFCNLFSLDCYDKETGDYIEMPWDVIGLLMGIAALLIFIDYIFQSIKERL